MGEEPKQPIDRGFLTDDLSDVVQRQKWVKVFKDGVRTPAPKEANEMKMRIFLEAGAREVLKVFGELISPVTLHGSPNRIVATVTKAKLLKAYEDLAKELDEPVGVNADSHFDSRWAYIEDFHDDLTRYIVRLGVDRRRMKEIDDLLPTLFHLSFGDLVALVAEAETTTPARDETLLLQQILYSAYPFDVSIQQRASDRYSHQVPAWAGIYARIAAVYEIPWAKSPQEYIDLATMLNTVVEGAFLRRRAGAEHCHLSRGVDVGLALIQATLASVAGRPWEDLEGLRADPALDPGPITIKPPPAAPDVQPAPSP